MAKADSFWTLFHKVWGEDSKLGDTPDSKYDQEAWTYVQRKVQRYLAKEAHGFSASKVPGQSCPGS